MPLGKQCIVGWEKTELFILAQIFRRNSLVLSVQNTSYTILFLILYYLLVLYHACAAAGGLSLRI
jgi:hypothetical protein